MRAAASSTASGRLSSRAQSSPISSLGSSCERSQKSSTASGSASGGTSYSTSPRTRRRSRLVTSKARLGQRSTSDASSGAASITCSRLSSKQQQLPLADVLCEPVLSAERLRDRLVTSAGSRSAARPTQKTPALYSGTRVDAASIARRVFPEPPGPVSVTRRAPFSIRDRQLGELGLPPDERARGPRQVRVRDRLERREGAVSELEDRDRLRNVLQPVLAEIGQLDVDELRGRGREDHLAAVARGAPRGRRSGRRRRRSPRRSASGVPVCRPTRTWIGPEAQRLGHRLRRRTSAPGAVGNAKKNASPCVSTSTPS